MGQHRTILIVDDSEVIRVMLRDMLQLWGYHPLTASNGVEALSVADTEPVDAVFTDLQIGEKTGLELCRDLRALADRRGRTLPVWLMSGSDEIDYSVEATRAGAVGFLRKPFNPAEIARRLAETVPIK